MSAETDPVEALQTAETELTHALHRLIYRTTASLTLQPDIAAVKERHGAACAAMQFSVIGEYEAARECLANHLRTAADIDPRYPDPIVATVKAARDEALAGVVGVLEARKAVAR